MNHVILLSGGKGTRMQSELPKVLHPVQGKPIIHRLLESVAPLCAKPTLVVGYKADEVMTATEHKYHYVLQPEQLGTGHAILCARPSLKDRTDIENIIILPGDHPLVSTDTLHRLVEAHNAQKATLTIGTTVVSEYSGDQAVFEFYGRVIKDEQGAVQKVVEFKDATPEERAVKEVNVSYYCINAAWLWDNITKIGNNNAAHEFYLTDIVEIACSQHVPVHTFVFSNTECLGINTKEQLAAVERILA
jgi:bifunctional UDP-N-acetylglucosamine pyrophosphorylase/glucosamine-1-phosphate N-acetyltransferase